MATRRLKRRGMGARLVWTGELSLPRWSGVGINEPVFWLREKSPGGVTLDLAGVDGYERIECITRAGILGGRTAPVGASGFKESALRNIQ